MMRDKNDVEVLIDEKKYHICGFESAEYLQKIAAYINRKIMAFKKKDYYAGLDRDMKNVMLSINLADDYYKEKKKADEYKKEGEAKDQSVLDMKHELMDLQASLKKKNAENERLKMSLEKVEKKVIELETRLKK